MPEELTHPDIPGSLREFQGSEKIVDPPRNEEIVDIQRQDWPATGNNCLVIFPTNNQEKVEAFKANYENKKPDDINAYFFLRVVTDDGGCSQPCNAQGYICARYRITKAMEIFQNEYPTFLKDKHVGTIIVSVIESFFEKKSVLRPVDAAVVGMFNVLTGKMVTATTEGVTLNKWFLEEAERMGGLVDGNEDCLRMTAGEVVATIFPSVDKANWQKDVAGRPRKEFFEKAIKGMEIPWT